MTTTREEPNPNRTMKDTTLSPSLQTHLLFVGIALFAAGALTLWLLPEASVWYVAVAVVVVAHIGLLMAVGAAILRWAAGATATTDAP